MKGKGKGKGIQGEEKQIRTRKETVREQMPAAQTQEAEPLEMPSEVCSELPITLQFEM